jgi:hypothetical protein
MIEMKGKIQRMIDMSLFVCFLAESGRAKINDLTDLFYITNGCIFQKCSNLKYHRLVLGR